MGKTSVTRPDQDGPSYHVIDITPATAKRWLRQNTHNRNLRDRVVNSYAADMRDGNWVEDGQAIKFARGDIALFDNPYLTGGPLLDGQHRLSAIVAANVTIRMLVVTGLPASTQDTMDTGAKRVLADALKLRGESHCVVLAAALVRVHQWQKGHRKNLRGAGTAKPTHRQLLALLEDHPELRRSVEIADRVRKSMRISGGTAALCHWLFTNIDSSDCAFFFARLADGAGLMTDDPIYALRRALHNFAADRSNPDESVVTAVVIKGWNAYRDGRSVQLLSYRPGGSRPEPYPEPK